MKIQLHMRKIIEIKFIFILVVLILVQAKIALGQTPNAYRTVSTADFRMDFYVLINNKKENNKSDLTYTWFKSQQLQTTVGGYAGYPLNGSYVKYFINGQLAEKGQFSTGLKVDQWMSWYPNGAIESIQNYKSGRLKGTYISYAINGDIIEQGKHIRGKKKLKKQYQLQPIKNEKDSLTDEITTKDRKAIKSEKSNKKKNITDETNQEKPSSWKKLIMNKKAKENNKEKSKRGFERETHFKDKSEQKKKKPESE
jgi:hypothetical protein